ncbi:MAG TPA: ATP-dependent metallopeptidase FtsH/Yme1/Tma family protein, partial [Thermomicrobiales bacterium]|nr:ATP-dependent metallopeptidase FtsH/Yme1/Tma family protein [Thermomicrobiales bacterium]
MSDNQNGNKPPRSPLPGPPDGERSRRPIGPTGPQPPQRRPRVPSWIVVVLLVGIIGWYAYQFFQPNNDASRTSIPYSSFLTLVEQDTVSTAVITQSEIDGDLKQEILWDKKNEVVVQPGADNAAGAAKVTKVKATIP